MGTSLQIRDFEKQVAAGDLAGMAQSVTSLHDSWASLSESEQQKVLKLEAIFLSLVQARTEAAR